MILKKEGNTDIDKLRTLVLFEADFNHNNKFLGRSMMHHMVDSNALAKEQYSSPGKKCIDHVVNRKLYFDLVRYQKTSAAMSGVDLKSCYDRVSHAPAYLAMRSFGIPLGTHRIYVSVNSRYAILHYDLTWNLRNKFWG